MKPHVKALHIGRAGDLQILNQQVAPELLRATRVGLADDEHIFHVSQTLTLRSEMVDDRGLDRSQKANAVPYFAKFRHQRRFSGRGERDRRRRHFCQRLLTSAFAGSQRKNKEVTN